jgi:type II secretory pathway pseudopilin PulG
MAVKKTHYSTSGFTIIETLIVFAVAGLLILLIFQAVPALQRGSRNDQRKQDVSLILDTISRFQLNNTGSFPVATDTLANAKLAYYVGNPALVATHPAVEQPTTGVAFNFSANAHTAAPESNTNTNSVWIYNHRKCNSDDSGNSTTQGAGFRDVVALYGIESSNSGVPQCKQL